MRKFGTFSGVFTPSILTILGVIMYLRFPTIIGQAGLINTIGIIVIAHIISFSTSLSVASLSTDKTVKTGGTYFMISRSLGLPIGGTLGLALFVGLSFSVSLYLIGFAESFLAYWGLDSSINSIRLTGTLILLVVTTITFISTSLAIKSQYFIMAAIGLSLLSIFFGKHEFAPAEINFSPMIDAAPFMILFGIFFPAVTGFEAGVSMSGDLKNPKKSLPLGAVSAVLVGFVVYIFLAFFYAYTVDANALRNDKEILFKIALVPGLVIVGIWGATLSSALGSILGAPRILQAIAMDKIAPKIFAKGTGKTNEPRNALLLSFVIAEAGILIGQLDVIARIVSMFFITTYAFLNLASAIESWSSSDFRPAFKIPRFVSIVGAAAAFIVMILLDFLALAGAVVVLGILFFYLKRKELVLETGDAWSSFWTNLAKHSLLELTKKKINTRNWRPNIILFSGGEQARPHLVELGLAMSGKLGALTDFELVVDPGTKMPVKSVLPPENGNHDLNFFRRQFGCDGVESGIKAVTSIYGFSGFEPNTIMMGWTRNVQNAEFLINVLQDFKRKNLNAVFLDYDKKHGFGKMERIDIWWGGVGRHFNFALGLVKFILSDHKWRDAKVRILIINNDKTITERLYRNTNILLEDKRIVAEVKILSNDFGSRTNEMIITSESANADLVMLGISEMTNVNLEHYIERINYLCELPASLLVLSPSEEFEEVNLLEASKRKTVVNTPVPQMTELQPLPVIENKVIKLRVDKIESELQLIGNLFNEKTIQEAVNNQLHFVQLWREFTVTNLKKLGKVLTEETGTQLVKSINKLHYVYLNFSTEFFDTQGRKNLLETREVLSEGITEFKQLADSSVYKLPDTVDIPVYDEKTLKEKNISFPYKRSVVYILRNHIHTEVTKQLTDFNTSTTGLYADLKKAILLVNDIYEKHKGNGQVVKTDLKESVDQVLDIIDKLEQNIQKQVPDSKAAMLSTIRNEMVLISADLISANAKKLIRRRIKAKPVTDIASIEAFPDEWEVRARVLSNSVFLDCHIISEQKIITSILQKNNARISAIINESVITPIDAIILNVEKSITGHAANGKDIMFADNITVSGVFQEAYTKILEFIERLPREIEISDYVNSDDDSGQETENISVVTVEPSRIALSYIDSRFFEPLFSELEQLDKNIGKAVIECREAYSLFKFRVDNAKKDFDEYSYPEPDLARFMPEIKEQILAEKRKLIEATARIKTRTEILIKDAFAPLYSHAIILTRDNLSTIVREKKGKKFGAGITKTLKQFTGRFNKMLVGMLYSSSDGVIMARNILKKKEQSKTSVRQLLDIAEKEMPDKRTFLQIPVFYRNLFSSKSLINDDFWVPMEHETLLMKNAIKRHKEGIGGAILITGVHGAGKTALSRYTVNRFFKKDRTFYIKPPLGGSAQPEMWLESLREATSLNGQSSSDILRYLPDESVVVINDLELWWERANNGYGVINDITELIRVYGKRVFFILNCNIFSYYQINKVLPIENFFLSVIECRPFDARQLQHLILNRHKSSGLSFHFRNISEELISQVKTASLFNSYFNYSKGVPGVALNAWISNVNKVEKQEIFIRKPETSEMVILDALDRDWLVLIALFVQHKYMNTEKLARVMNIPYGDAEKMIYNLSNAGIIDVRKNDVMMLNRYLEQFLVNKCSDYGLI